MQTYTVRVRQVSLVVLRIPPVASSSREVQTIRVSWKSKHSDGIKTDSLADSLVRNTEHHARHKNRESAQLLTTRLRSLGLP